MLIWVGLIQKRLGKLLYSELASYFGLLVLNQNKAWFTLAAFVVVHNFSKLKVVLNVYTQS